LELKCKSYERNKKTEKEKEKEKKEIRADRTDPAQPARHLRLAERQILSAARPRDSDFLVSRFFSYLHSNSNISRSTTSFSDPFVSTRF
jgi:hypothetical protein